MNTKMIPMIAAIAIAAVILTSLALLSENDILPFQPPPKAFDWECSGPICIRPAEVKLGENIFIIADGIEEDEIIRLSFTNADGKHWGYIYADGSEKSQWNKYIKPDYSRYIDFCTLDDLTGLWTIELQGTNYMPIQFQHGPAILDGSEEHYTKEKNVCP